MPRGRVSGPDPRWGDYPDDTVQIPAPPPTSIIPAPPPTFLVPAQIPAPPGRSEFNPPPAEPEPDSPVLTGHGYMGPDPIQVTGVRRRMSVDPIELNGPGISRISNPGMPGGGDAAIYPSTDPPAIQGVPDMLARPQDAALPAPRPRPRLVAKTPSVPLSGPPPPSGQPDSDFNAYLAQRAKEIADLKRAQGTADESRRWQEISNNFVRAGDAAAGRPSNENALQTKIENTGQPVRNVLQQQEAGRQATGEALAQTTLSGKMWEHGMATQAADPNSPISQRTQAFLASTGLFPKGSEKFVSAADYEKALQAGAQGIHALQLKAQIAHQNAQLEIERGKAAEDIRHHNQEFDVGMIRARPPVQPAQQADIESLINGAASLNDLDAVNSSASWPNRIGSVFGIGPAAETRKAVAPEVAKASAKGRVNPAGEVKEANSLPGPNTSGGSDNLRTRRQNMLRDADTKLRVLEHDPRVDPNSVAEMRRQLNDEMQRHGSAQGGPAQQSARPRRTVGNETREWNGSAWVPVNG